MVYWTLAVTIDERCHMNKADKLARAARARALLETVDEPVPAPQATARESAGQKGRAESAPHVTRSGFVLEPYYGTGYDERLVPKNWPSPPKVGDMVFYRDQRFWVEDAPSNWLGTTFVRIGDHRVHVVEGVPRAMHEKRISFCVYADLLKPIPADFNTRAKRLPTVASVAARQRSRSGIRDVGDEVATMLRDCATLDQVYKAASKYLDIDEAELRGKYGHLNPGQQRMNLGNKMRFKWRKEHV